MSAQDAITRLQTGYYNSEAVSETNPGGLGAGGHVSGFPKALKDAARQLVLSAAALKDAGDVAAYQAAIALGQLSQLLSSDPTLQRLFGKLHPDHFSFSQPILHDLANVRGGGPAIYVPQQLFFRRAGDYVYSANLLPSSAQEPGYVKVTGSADVSFDVYIDFGQVRAGNYDCVRSVAAPNAPDDALSSDYLWIGTFWANGYSSPFRVAELRDLSATRIAWARDFVIQDDGSGARKLLVPGGIAYRADKGAQGFAPNDGAFYEIAISNEAKVHTTYVLDWPTLTAGAAPPVGARTSVVTDGVVTYAPDTVGGVEVHAFATSLAGHVTSSYRFVGEGQIAANQALGGLDPAASEFFLNATAAAAITEPNLTARGFTTGFRSPTDGAPYIGGLLSEVGPRPFFFARIYVQSDIDNDFGAPCLVLTAKSGAYATFPLTLEKRFSARGAMFSAKGQWLVNEAAVGWQVGNAHAIGRDLRSAGAQVAVRDTPVAWIDRLDYPTGPNARAALEELIRRRNADVAPDWAFPPALFLTPGRPLSFYPSNCTGRQGDNEATLFEIGAAGATGASAPAQATGREHLRLDGQTFQGSGEIVARNARNPKTRYVSPVVVNVAGDLVGRKPVVLTIGDSLTNLTIGQLLREKLVSLGAAPTFIGTITQDTDGVGQAVLGEARGGKSFGDLTYAVATPAASDVSAGCKPLPVGQEAAYLASTTDQKRKWNPFLRPSVGGDNGAYVRNGYVFDMAFYLTRFGLATPTHVALTLGTNDEFMTPNVAAVNVRDGLSIVTAQIRNALPNAWIGVVPVRPAYTDLYQDKGFAMFRDVILEHHKFARANTDARIALLPLYAHLARDVGWSRTIVTTDVVTGLQSTTVSDEIHFSLLNRQTYAELLAAWIGATMSPAPVAPSAGPARSAAWSLISAAVTARPGARLLCDTSTAGFTITLPAGPSRGDSVVLRDAAETWSSRPVVVGRNGQTISGAAEDLTLNLDAVEVGLVFTGSTWRTTLVQPL